MDLLLSQDRMTLFKNILICNFFFCNDDMVAITKKQQIHAIVLQFQYTVLLGKLKFKMPNSNNS